MIRVSTILNNKLTEFDIPKSDIDAYALLSLWAKLDCGCKAFEAARLQHYPLVRDMLLTKRPNHTTGMSYLGITRTIYFNRM
jgi:hypothetical protein